MTDGGTWPGRDVRDTNVEEKHIYSVADNEEDREMYTMCCIKRIKNKIVNHSRKKIKGHADTRLMDE